MKIDEKTKELIAIGASVTAGCKPCLEYHVAKGKEAGACDDEIVDAVAVAKMVRKGAMSKMDKFAGTVLTGDAVPESSDDCTCV